MLALRYTTLERLDALVQTKLMFMLRNFAHFKLLATVGFNLGLSFGVNGGIK